MTYNVFGVTLNPTLLVNISETFHCSKDNASLSLVLLLLAKPIVTTY